MNAVIKIIVAILAVIVAFKIIKGLFGLLIGLALAAALYVGATKLLEKK